MPGASVPTEFALPDRAFYSLLEVRVFHLRA